MPREYPTSGKLHTHISLVLLTLLCLSVVLPAYTGVATADSHSSSDPSSDAIGWENGRWHNESIGVSYDNGLNDSELGAVINRSMARVEYLRDAEFTDSVDTRVITRTEFKENNPMTSKSGKQYGKWNNQVWEALFIVGESDDANQKLNSMYNGSVLGYYSPSASELVLVVPSDQTVHIPEATLVHELTHALQDQRYDLTKSKYSGKVQDAQLGTNGLIEGEANYIEQRFKTLCMQVWSCNNPTTGGSSASPGNIGMQMVVYQPYSDGGHYIHRLVQEGGWERVDAVWKDPPKSSREIIHPGASPATNISIDSPRNNTWTPISNTLGRNGSDSVGEASMYVMFWYQTYKYNIETIPRSNTSRGDSRYDTYNYNHPISAGLLGDSLKPYTNGEQNGYVWKTYWETPQDAEEFVTAYETVLSGHGGEQTSRGWKIPNGEYSDGFVIVQDGDTVYISNAPTIQSATGLLPENVSTNPSNSSDSSTSEKHSVQTATSSESEPSSIPRVASLLVVIALLLLGVWAIQTR